MSEVKLYCTVCGEETEKVITIDIDVEAIPVCESHVQEVKLALYMEVQDEPLFRKLVKKWKTRIN